MSSAVAISLHVSASLKSWQKIGLPELIPMIQVLFRSSSVLERTFSSDRPRRHQNHKKKLTLYVITKMFSLMFVDANQKCFLERKLGQYG